jgi:transcription elongation factor GreA
MASDRSAPALLREAGLMADGPAEWGRPLRYDGPGVFLVELPAPVASPAMDLAPVGKWLERVPDLRLDGARPTSRDLVERLRTFWLPSQPVVLIGSTERSVGGRLAAIAKTVPGDRKPAWTGFWLHFLRNASDLRVWWATTPDADATELAELELMEAFAKGVPADEAAALRPGSAVLPWAVLQTKDAGRKLTGISNPLLPEPVAPKAKPVSRIVELPTAEADGAQDEAKRGRRPAPGRGTGRIASAAAYAAQGSPRKASEEPILLSPEGHERLLAELAELVKQRPDVIKRIATAREHGDLKENAEYHAAREEQGFLEGRIKSLEAKLKLARVVEPTVRGQHVELGSRVRVEVDGEESTLTVVSSAEASSREGRISKASPVGAALMGRQVGDAVTIITPGGQIRYAILEIG